MKKGEIGRLLIAQGHRRIMHLSGPTGLIGVERRIRGYKRALASARLDEERLRADGCLAFEGATKPADCVYGVKDGAFTLALVGDSHAAAWFPALERRRLDHRGVQARHFAA